MLADSEKKIQWQKENMMAICFKLHRKYDADIIAFLNEKGADKQKEIKAAIREYMKEGK